MIAPTHLDAPEIDKRVLEQLNAKIVTHRPDFFLSIGWTSFAEVEEVQQFLDDTNLVQLDSETNGLSAFVPKARMWCFQIGNKDVQYILDLPDPERLKLLEDSVNSAILEQVQDKKVAKRFEFPKKWIDETKRQSNIEMFPEVEGFVDEYFGYINLKDFKSRLETRDPKKKFIFHRGVFDLAQLMYQGIVMYPKNIMDTFIGEFLLSAGINQERGSRYERNLAACVKRRLSKYMSKEDRQVVMHHGLTKLEAIVYSAYDVVHMEDLLKAQLEHIKARNMVNGFLLQCGFLSVCAYMEYCGVKVRQESNDRNLPSWEVKMMEDQYQSVKALKELDAYVKENYPEVVGKRLINWGSSPQTIAFLKAVGVDTVDKKTGKDVANIDYLARFKKDFKVVDLYIKYKKTLKNINTYGQKFLDAIQDDGRIHTSWNPVVATFRTSCGGKGSPAFVNLQNVPNGYPRSCFVPQNKLYTFVNADYGDQEGHTGADKSQDPDLLAFYNQGGGDKHSLVASMFRPATYEQIKEAKRKKEAGEPLTDFDEDCLKWRQEAKAGGFAVAYGGNEKTIADNLNISIEEAKVVYDGILNAFPGQKDYFDRVEREAKARGLFQLNKVTGECRYIEDFDLYRRYAHYSHNDWSAEMASMDTKAGKAEIARLKKWTRKKSGEIRRLALNTPIQGTAADMTKKAALDIYLHIIQFRDKVSKDIFGKVKIVLFVHDELVLEVPKSKAEEWAGIVKYYMEASAKLFCPSVNIKTNPVIADYWDH